MSEQNPRESEDEESYGWRETVGGILAAGLGIRSNADRERDFKHGSARQFIIAGVIGTVLFVLAIYTLVQVILYVAV